MVMMGSTPIALLLALLCVAHRLHASTHFSPPSQHVFSSFAQQRVDCASQASHTHNRQTPFSTSSPWPETVKFAVDYYPSQWPRSMWEDDAARMANASITHVRISEFDWAILEPTEGVYDWTLLDESIDVLSRHGLQVVLGTPTATPPIWVVEKYDVLGVNEELRVRRFGSRRHYSFSSPDYAKLSVGIVEAMARRYGSHPAVAAWQLDNEYGNSRTARSYDVHATQNFRRWLEQKYDDSIEELNKSQGRVFWSSQFQSFEQIFPPTLENEESSPALRLDFFHFSSDQLIAFAASHAHAIRRIAMEDGYEARPITTNFMGFEFSFDHFAFVEETQIDFATWDSYPLGNAEMLPWISEADKVRYGRTGLPDHQALQHAIFRGVAGVRTRSARGPWGVMEQQPGPVNWALANPSPAPGQVRLWLHDMIAMGSSLNNIFRWRQAPYGQEQMHAGMLRPDDEYDLAWHEQQRTRADVEALLRSNVSLEVEAGAQADIAIVVDFTSHWFIEAQPQSGRFQTNTFVGYTFQYGEVLSNWHSALRRLALDVDLVAPSTNLSGYKLVLVPTMVNMSAHLDEALLHFEGEVIVGARTASKKDPMTIPDGLAPSASLALSQRLPMKVTRVESIRNGGLGDEVRLGSSLCDPTVSQCTFSVHVWSEWLECSRNGLRANEEPQATFVGYRDGAPAMCTHAESDERRTTYLGWYAYADELLPLIADAARRNGIRNLFGRLPNAKQDDLGGHVRFARRGNALFAFNYDDKREADIGEVLHKAAQAGFALQSIVGKGTRIEKSGVNIFHVQ